MSRKVDITCDCVVVGGGASGMMAAITAAQQGADVILIEHTKRLGSKILQTGNGKCNFTNLNMDMSKYQNEETAFVEKVIEQFDVAHTIEFFKSIGVYHKEKNGYVYPNSETAASLQDALRMKVLSEQVRVLELCEIGRIERCAYGSKERAKDGFSIYAEQYAVVEDQDAQISKKRGTDSKNKKKKNKEEQIVKVVDCKINAKTVILATGSKAAPKTGSDGSGYEIAAKLGHTIVKPLPALVQLESDDPLCKAMAGVRSTGKVCLKIEGTETAQDTGEIQYTDYGISGIPVFQISRYAVRAVDGKRHAEAVIDMLPDYTEEALKRDAADRKSTDGQKTTEQFFSGLINKKLVYAAAVRAGVDINARVQEVKQNRLNEMIHIMKCFGLEITGFKDFSNGQICQGGVSLKEINPDTMESTYVKGLFFAGELMDVDGQCGGYNLQWAWSSGHLAGISAAKQAGKQQASAVR